MAQIKTLLDLPLGESIAEGNWENYVYELGDEYVYKETRSAEDIDLSVPNYLERVILQRFWNTEVHFTNARNDYQIFKTNLEQWIPETYFFRTESKLSKKNSTSIIIQKKIEGTLLSGYGDELPPEYKTLREQVRQLCLDTFKAPADFHPGNLIFAEGGRLYFFDTGTPSDWEYFLDKEKLVSLLNITKIEAEQFVNFMANILEKHWQNINGISVR